MGVSMIFFALPVAALERYLGSWIVLLAAIMIFGGIIIMCWATKKLDEELLPISPLGGEKTCMIL